MICNGDSKIQIGQMKWFWHLQNKIRDEDQMDKSICMMSKWYGWWLEWYLCYEVLCFDDYMTTGERWRSMFEYSSESGRRTEQQYNKSIDEQTRRHSLYTKVVYGLCTPSLLLERFAGWYHFPCFLKWGGTAKIHYVDRLESLTDTAHWMPSWQRRERKLKFA